ncbi:MAG: fused MFS/spermidine synthase [Desulfarculales bacterium]|nr:fused MFS/spermidine synthase [Desulfarculales bacterium]
MATQPAAAKIIYETDSLYHHIVVREDDQGKRFLAFNRARGDQSAVVPGHPEILTFAYTKTAMAALSFLEREPERMLFIGVGAGSIPAYMRLIYPHAVMDLVEIDPDVIRVAKEYFEFRPDALMREIIKDGRVFLRTAPYSYDFIFLDAYNDASVPFHLTTQEFLSLAREKLNPGGVLASNVWSASINRYFNAQINTYQEVFGLLYLFQAKNTGNYIFVVTKPEKNISRSQLAGKAKAVPVPSGTLDLTGIVKSEFTPVPRTGEPILSDDFAPVDVLRYQ